MEPLSLLLLLPLMLLLMLLLLLPPHAGELWVSCCGRLRVVPDEL
jgi:hypothetical protein